MNGRMFCFKSKGTDENRDARRTRSLFARRISIIWGQLQLSRLILRGKDIVRIDFMVFFKSRLTPCSAAIQHLKNTSPPHQLKVLFRTADFWSNASILIIIRFLLFLFTQCNQVFVDDSVSNVVFEVNCIVLFWKLHMKLVECYVNTVIKMVYFPRMAISFRYTLECLPGVTSKWLLNNSDKLPIEPMHDRYYVQLHNPQMPYFSWQVIIFWVCCIFCPFLQRKSHCHGLSL